MGNERSFAESFEDLKVWQASRTLTNDVYNAVRNCKDYAFRDQIQRAATSVMNNISEGFERRTKKDFAHFLDLAKIGKVVVISDDEKDDYDKGRVKTHTKLADK
jgi:hypothetical protein